MKKEVKDTSELADLLLMDLLIVKELELLEGEKFIQEGGRE